MIRQVTYTVAGGQLHGSDVIIGRADVGDYELVATGAGVSCVNSITRLLKSYATLANITALAYNSVTGDLWLGTTAGGCFVIAAATMTGGAGDVTPVGWAAWLTTATAPAIYSNAIAAHGLAWNDAGTRLAISCGTGAASRLNIYNTTGPAVYDSSSVETANGPVAVSGNVVYWVSNGDIGKIYKLNNITTPGADGFHGDACYLHISDDFNNASIDSARWTASITSGAPTAWAITEASGKASFAMTHANAPGWNAISLIGSNWWLGLGGDFSIAFQIANYTYTPDSATDEVNAQFDFYFYTAALGQQLFLRATCAQTSAAKTITATLKRGSGNTTIFSTAVAVNWTAACTLYIERVGNVISISYDIGGGKTLINNNNHADNATGVILRHIAIESAQNEQTVPYTRTSSFDLLDFKVATPASYDDLWNEPIISLDFAPGAGSDVLLVGTATGLYKLDTDDSAGWASAEDFTLETYGAAGSGADHEILESSDVLAVAYDSVDDVALVGTDGSGLDLIEFTGNTREEHWDTATTPALLSDTVTGVWFGSWIYGSGSGMGILDNAAGSAALTMMLAMKP